MVNLSLFIYKIKLDMNDGSQILLTGDEQGDLYIICDDEAAGESKNKNLSIYLKKQGMFLIYWNLD